MPKTTCVRDRRDSLIAGEWRVILKLLEGAQGIRVILARTTIVSDTLLSAFHWHQVHLSCTLAVVATPDDGA